MADPVVTEWDGEPLTLVETARVRLGLAPTDPDLPWLGTLAMAIRQQVIAYTDPVQRRPSVFPADVYAAAVLALVDAYRRKDVKFGVAGSWSADGIALRVSADWLDGVKAALRPHIEQWGLA